jgi:hypothetical protein
VRLGIGIDAVTLAAGTLQSVRGDLKLDGDEWDVETLELRAPGFAQVRLSGRVAHADGITFKGPAQIEASNPKAFVAWLEGRPDTTHAPAGTLRVAGEGDGRRAGVRGRPAQARARPQGDRGPHRLCGRERREAAAARRRAQGGRARQSTAYLLSAAPHSTARRSNGRA